MENLSWPVAFVFFVLWLQVVIRSYRYEQQRRKRFEDTFDRFLDDYPLDRDLGKDEAMKRKLYRHFKNKTKHWFILAFFFWEGTLYAQLTVLHTFLFTF